MTLSAARTNDARSLRTQIGHIDKLHGEPLAHAFNFSANLFAAESSPFSARIISLCRSKASLLDSKSGNNCVSFAASEFTVPNVLSIHDIARIHNVRS